MRPIFVTGTGTGIGKTIFCAALVGALDGCYWKPIQAGLEGETDSECVARLSGLAPDRVLPEAYRLVTPCSPHRAAELDGIRIDLDRLALPLISRPLVVEGAGGAMVPVTRQATCADLAAHWNCSSIIVAQTTLGTISHSLAIIEALQRRGAPILGMAFVGEEQEDSERTICEMGGVRRLGRLPLLDPLDSPSLAAAFGEAFEPGSWPT